MASFSDHLQTNEDHALTDCKVVPNTDSHILKTIDYVEVTVIWCWRNV